MRKPGLIAKLIYKLFFFYWSPILEDSEHWREDIKKKIEWLGEEEPNLEKENVEN